MTKNPTGKLGCDSVSQGVVLAGVQLPGWSVEKYEFIKVGRLSRGNNLEGK